MFTSSELSSEAGWYTTSDLSKKQYKAIIVTKSTIIFNIYSCPSPYNLSNLVLHSNNKGKTENSLLSKSIFISVDNKALIENNNYKKAEYIQFFHKSFLKKCVR